jgi:hypothetical protein
MHYICMSIQNLFLIEFLVYCRWPACLVCKPSLFRITYFKTVPKICCCDAHTHKTVKTSIGSTPNQMTTPASKKASPAPRRLCHHFGCRCQLFGGRCQVLAFQDLWIQICREFTNFYRFGSSLLDPILPPDL